ncbi:MAG TPA: CDP-alcohol phosphatidyltransferase family protein [Verrucomicrobiae bacterium]|nr:CDP-alcohol phosphatidyltransferase family protein [Verrucomicrobiae bacterium]
MKRHLPFALTTLRLLLGPVALTCALTGVDRRVFVPLLLAGTLSDIFDGVLARRFGVATPALRRYDSITDVIYYLFILACLWLRCRPVVLDNVAAIAAILLSEIAVIAVCVVKFGKYPATHSWLAKFYGLCLLGALMALLAFAAGRWAVLGLMTVALVTNLEIIVMHLLARQPPVDVKSIFCLRRMPAVPPAVRSRQVPQHRPP